MSRKSFGEVLRVPVIASAAILWIFFSLHSAATEPEFLVCPSCLLGGVYQVSIPQVIFGNATDLQSCCISLDLILVEGLVSLLNWRIHFVTLAVVLWACSFQVRRSLMRMPRYLQLFVSFTNCPSSMSSGLGSGMQPLLSGSRMDFLEKCYDCCYDRTPFIFFPFIFFPYPFYAFSPFAFYLSGLLAFLPCDLRTHACLLFCLIYSILRYDSL